MTDPNEIVDAYTRYRRLLSEANKINKNILFEALASAGIASVIAEFDGQGDSGQIQDISARSDEAEIPLPDLSITMQTASHGTGKQDSTERSLRDAIEALCYDYLAQERGGWQDNDGAFGAFIFDVAERKIDLEFNARFTDSTLFCHSF
jgi:hypothetical protein